MISHLRLAIRLPLFVLMVLWCIGTSLALRLADPFLRTPISRQAFGKVYMQLLCRLLGMRIQVYGQPCAEPVMFVSNHISWSDIPVLASCTPLRFLAKQEVRQWPLIGLLAREAGTLFIKRGGGQSMQVRQNIATALAQGASILVFPEGTTSNGIDVLKFHGRLLAATIPGRNPVQPISLGYRRDESPDLIAPFIGDDQFHHHILRMLGAKATSIQVIFHPPVRLTDEDQNEAFACMLQETVANGLRRIHGAQGKPPVLALQGQL